MKILFICPNLYDKRSFDAFQPLAFAVLKGLTPDDVETVLYDERIEKIDFEETADLVAISVGTFTAKRSYAIADEFRERGIPVVMGGYHPTFKPEEALHHSDSVVMGDAEPIWKQVVEDARLKRLERIYKGKTSNDTLKGVHYDRSIFKDKKYKVIQPVQYNRGCKYNCDFCSVSEFYGKGSFHRPIKDVVQEIESLDKKAIFFIDDNLFANRGDAMRFFKELIPLNIVWGAQISIEAGQDKELLDMMVKSGCILLLMGFETLDIENLKQMNKKANIKNNDYTNVIERLYDYGLMIYGTFVLGYDFDTKDSFDRILEFAIKSKFTIANFNPLMSMPGTQLYKRLEGENRHIYNKWWLHDDYKYGDAMFYPKNMSPEELQQGCIKARKDFYKYSSIFKRMFHPKANARSLKNLMIHLIFNLMSRKEILAKQSSSLG
jgi:radical SAM superfamily enzyme YgiQ (UPF0313 family)